jgi:formylglycine-generating enzyme required for sulfatase activity
MVFVPAGEFLMGSPEKIGIENEHPQHSVYLDGFWIDQTEVTNSTFRDFVKQTGYKTEAERVGESSVIEKGDEFGNFVYLIKNGANWSHPFGPESDIEGLDDHPVVHISWYDAQEYCTWAGKRLPTEAEWEKAARGVSGSTYPWGNDFPAGNLANYTATHFWDEPTKDGYQFSAPVGTYPGGKSPYGAVDMAGNVWEWVLDRYDDNYYSKGENSNPTGPVEGTLRVVRGGSFYSKYPILSSAYRERQVMTYSSIELGFRCAQSE